MQDVWAEIAAEREDLADLLNALTPEEWATQSLCAEWTVRDVAGHMIEGTEKMSLPSALAGIAKNRFNVNTFIANSAKHYASRPTDDIVQSLRKQAGSKETPPFVKPIDMLVDAVIHAQDVRRPLGKPRAIPEERLRTVLDHAVLQGSLGNKKRIAGVTLVATDIEWQWGSGPDVRGTGEALLMATSGRSSALDDLDGEGLATLRSR